MYSSLFPNPVQPRHGIFVENRLRHLLASQPVTARVMAPVPWYPAVLPAIGDYGVYARVPKSEQRSGIAVEHPRYGVLPKVSWRFSPWLMYRASLGPARALLASFDFDVIDAHFFYPDGVAAVMLGRALGKPVVITARGNDLSLMPRYWLPRKMILWAAQNAAHLITVCQALKDTLLELGVAEQRVSVLRNGVDLELFHPLSRATARAALGLSGRVLLSVGHLIERKGNHLTIEALAALPDVRLLLVGDGPEEAALRRLARTHGVEDRVRFCGAVPQAELPRYYAAADALVLASSREGWANVLLEAMACGTPVLATSIWGTPEVVATPAAGVLMKTRTSAAMVDAYRQLFADYPDHAATRAYAEGFTWDATSLGQYRIFAAILGTRAAAV